MSQKKYSISLFRKEFEKLYNNVNFESLMQQFRGFTKDIDLNDLNAETLFDDIEFRRIRFEDVEKSQIGLKSKLSNVKIGGKKSDEQLSETTIQEKRLSGFITIISKWYKSR